MQLMPFLYFCYIPIRREEEKERERKKERGERRNKGRKEEKEREKAAWSESRVEKMGLKGTWLW